MNKMKNEVRRQQDVRGGTDIIAEVDVIYTNHGDHLSEQYRDHHQQPSTERSNSAGMAILHSSTSDPKQGIVHKSGKKIKKQSKEVKYTAGVILPSLEMYNPSHVIRSRSPIATEDGNASNRAPWTIATDIDDSSRGARSPDKDTTLHRLNSLQLMSLSSPMGSRPTTSQSSHSDSDNMSRPSTGSSTGSRGQMNRNGSQGVLNSPNNSFLDWDRFGSSITSDISGGSLDLSNYSPSNSFSSPSRELGPTLHGDAISRVSNIVANNLSSASSKKLSTRISMSSFEPIPELVSGHDGDEDIDDDGREMNRQISNYEANTSNRKQNDDDDDGNSDESDDEEIGWSPFTMIST